MVHEHDRARELEAEAVAGLVDADAVLDLADMVDADAVPGEVTSPGNDYVLSENVARDLVKYVRSNTIRNEQQFLLLQFALASGLSDDPGEFISTATIGTSSGGKSHLKDKAVECYEHLNVMDVSTGSEKVLIYSDDWDEADLINMGELQQPPKEMLEFMKRAFGGDEEVVIRNTEGNPSTGFEENVIRKKAKSYHFTYAQFSADFEFWNRLLKIPVHESESKNRAVGRMKFGHEDIDLGDGITYGYPFVDGTERLQAHMLDVARNAPGRAVVPDGGERFGWDVWPIVDPIFRHGRSEVNRIYGMVANLVKASARLNFRNRDVVAVDGSDAVVAAPQDLANVLRCLDVLRATTHEITPRKRAVVEAIKAVSDDDGVVSGIEPIIDFLEDSDASQVKLSELENVLDELEEEYLIMRDRGEIQARNWDALGEPAVLDHADVFEGCTDPMTGEDFLEAWVEYREDALGAGDELVDEADINSHPASYAGGEADSSLEELEESLSMDTWEAEVAQQVAHTLDDQRLGQIEDLPVESFLGLAPLEPDEIELGSVTTDGTVLDPDHRVWRDSSAVTTEGDARQRCQQVVGKLIAGGHVTVTEIHEARDDRPDDVTVAVEMGVGE